MRRTIVLIDDHQLFREGLRRILEEDAQLQVVGDAREGQDGLSLIAEHKPDFALVDLSMKGLSGMELIRQITSQSPNTRVIVVSQHDTRGHLVQAVQSGASAYVVKSSGPEDIRAALEAVQEGKSFVSPSLAHLLVEAMGANKTGRAGASGLTAREREVLGLIAEGLSSKEIAGKLGLSPKTIETHRANLMSKLDVHKTSKLVRVAIEEGLVGA